MANGELNVSEITQILGKAAADKRHLKLMCDAGLLTAIGRQRGVRSRDGGTAPSSPRGGGASARPGSTAKQVAEHEAVRESRAEERRAFKAMPAIGISCAHHVSEDEVDAGAQTHGEGRIKHCRSWNRKGAGVAGAGA